MADNRIIAVGIIIIIAVVAVAYWYTSIPPEVEALNVCVAYDVGGRGDKSFNDMAYFGVSKSAQEFGVNITEITPLSLAEMEDVLRTLSQGEQYDLILCIGFLWTDALNVTAPDFPDQYYAGIDIYLPQHENVLSIVYREEEGCVLVGAVAALITNSSTVGNVLGMEIPVLWKFEIGYKYGVQYINNVTGRDVDVLWDYTGEFDRPDLGRESCIAMLDAGADVVFIAAGETGLGALDVVAEAGEVGELPFAFGVDANQDWVKPGRIIVSMRKLVDYGTYTAVKQVAEDNFQGGTVMSLGIAEGGIGLSDLDDLDDWLTDPMNDPEVIETETGMNVTEIRDIVESMRNAWTTVTIDGEEYNVWDIVDDLQQDILSGALSVPVPDSDTIEYYRSRY